MAGAVDPPSANLPDCLAFVLAMITRDGSRPPGQAPLPQAVRGAPLAYQPFTRKKSAYHRGQLASPSLTGFLQRLITLCLFDKAMPGKGDRHHKPAASCESAGPVSWQLVVPGVVCPCRDDLNHTSE